MDHRQNAIQQISRAYSPCLTETLCPLISTCLFPLPQCPCGVYVTYPRPLFRKALADRAISPSTRSELLSALEGETSDSVHATHPLATYVIHTLQQAHLICLTHEESRVYLYLWVCENKRLIAIDKKAETLPCGLIKKKIDDFVSKSKNLCGPGYSMSARASKRLFWS